MQRCCWGRGPWRSWQSGRNNGVFFYQASTGQCAAFARLKLNEELFAQHMYAWPARQTDGFTGIGTAAQSLSISYCSDGFPKECF